MIPFGKTLREAREARGYTIAQIAEMTRMMSSMVNDLENENFSKLAAPIYGRGFVKLYCEAVGIDPKPLVAEFMDLYNGNHEPVIRERPTSAAPVVDEPPPEPIAPPRPIQAVPPRPVQTIPPRPVQEIIPEPPARPPLSQPGLFDAPLASVPPSPEASAETVSAEEPRFARYASPLAERRGMGDSALSLSIILRWGIIGCVAALALWGIAIGLKSLYRATTAPSVKPAVAAKPAAVIKQVPAAKPAAVVKQAPVEKTAPSASSKPATPAKPATTAKSVTKPATRKPQDIPPLYLD